MNRIIITLISTIGISACGGDGDGADGGTPEAPYSNFFTPIPSEAIFPPDNAFSEEKKVLGEFLFWDPILSGRRDVACATCHHPDHGWADARTKSIGVDGVGLGPNRQGSIETPFHSPTVLNVAFTGMPITSETSDFVSGGYFWDLRATTLEEQAIEPIKSTVEMRSTDFLGTEIMDEVINRLKVLPEYQALFDMAFDEEDPISETNIAKALATYQRTLITQPTRFDDFLNGDDLALTEREITGLNKFINGGCADCHSGPLLSDNLIDQERIVQRGKPAVRTPSLRNLELTAPYMHDGAVEDLRGAVSIYEDRGDLNVILEEDDFGDIEAFLRTLTDSAFPQSIPVYVPSQLPVGGNLDPNQLPIGLSVQ